MNVEFTADQRAFAQQAIESGRFQGEEEVVQQALSLWESRERTRAELLAAINDADASIDRGEGRVITEQSMRDLASEVNRRGRERWLSDQGIQK